METRDQKLSTHIFKQVSTVAETNRQKYGSMAHKLPILIRTAGLVQALTFVEARREAAHLILLDHIAEVVGFKERNELIEKSRTAPLDEYMRLSQHVMAALLWYKRFAQSLLGVEQGTDSEEEPTNASVSS